MDKKEIIDIIEKSGKHIADLPQSRKEMETEDLVRYVKQYIKLDKDICMALAKAEAHALKFIPKEMLKDEDIILAGLNTYLFALDYASDEMKSDKEFMLRAVRKRSDALMYASREIRDDFDVVYAAVEKNPYSVINAALRLKYDPRIIALLNDRFDTHYSQYEDFCHDIYEEIDEENYIDQERYIVDPYLDQEEMLRIVTEGAMDDYHIDFSQMSDELKGDKEFALELIEHVAYDAYRGNIYENLSDDLKNDSDVVIMCLNQWDDCLIEFSKLPEKLRSDKNVAYAAIDVYWSYYKYVSKELQSDRDIFNAMLKWYSKNIQFPSPDYEDRTEFKEIMSMVPKEILADNETASAVINIDWRSFAYISDELKNDKNWIITTINGYRNEHDHVIKCTEEDYLTKMEEDFLNILSHIPKKIWEDKEICLMTIQNSNNAYKFIPEKLKKDADIIDAIESANE